jgi:tripartite-type tricarboxylate transporter receptor subunit TctC
MKKIAFLLVSFLMAGFSHASDNVRVTYGFGLGTGDTVIRTLATDAENQGTTKFRVENKPGAAGVIALREYYKEPASAKSLLGITGGQTVFEAVTNPENNFLDRMRVIGPVVTSPLAIAVNADSEFKTMDDLLDRRKPRRAINIGVGGMFHEAMVTLIAKHSHHDIQAVRFKGGADSFAALRGRHIDAEVNAYGAFLPHVADVRILAVGQPQSLPHAPSMLKWIPEANMVNFFAIAINKEVTDTKPLEKLFADGFTAAQRRQFWESRGFGVDANTKADFVERVMIPELTRWQKVLPAKKN